MKIWKDLRDIIGIWQEACLLSGDFNVVRFRNKKKGKSLNYTVSKKFNSIIAEFQLIDLKPTETLLGLI